MNEKFEFGQEVLVKGVVSSNSLSDQGNVNVFFSSLGESVLPLQFYLWVDPSTVTPIHKRKPLSEIVPGDKVALKPGLFEVFEVDSSGVPLCVRLTNGDVRWFLKEDFDLAPEPDPEAPAQEQTELDDLRAELERVKKERDEFAAKFERLGIIINGAQE